MGEAAEAGLQPADDERDVPKDPPDHVGVDDGGPVGAEAGLIPGGIGVVPAALFGHGVVGHHGVDVAAGDHHPQPGTTQGGEGGGVLPIRLGQHRHPVALGLQHPGDDGRTEGGVVHIGVAGDDEEIAVLPAAGPHICFGDREELGVHGFFTSFVLT